MKKIYIKPIVEQTECVHSTALLEGTTFFHAEGKGIDFESDDAEEDAKDQMKRNLWDD